MKGDEEQEEERPGSSTSRSCSNDCGCERLPQNARITIIKKSELTEIKASAKAKKKQRMKEEKGARRNREKDDEAAMKNEQMEEYEGKRSSVSTSASTSQEDFEEVITGDEKTDSPVHSSTTYSTYATKDRIRGETMGDRDGKTTGDKDDENEWCAAWERNPLLWRPEPGIAANITNLGGAKILRHRGI